MKKFLACVLSAFVVVSFASASTEQERRLEYTIHALDCVTTMRNWIGDIDGYWWTNTVAPFIGGVADSTMDLERGPGLYNASSSWEDSRGYSIFSSYGSIKKIESGMNYMDFPMYLSYWRIVSVQLDGVSSDSAVWINGSMAWRDGELWVAYVGAPWNMTKLTVLWAGHGQWSIPVSPKFDYDKPIVLDQDEMDTSVKVPAQVYALSYLGEISQPAEKAIFVSDVVYDETLGAQVLVCYNTLYKDHGSFKVLVALENYDRDLVNTVQYFSCYVEVNDGVFMIPLINGGGENLGIPDMSHVRFVYADPSDGGVYKQDYDFTIFWDSSEGGKG